MLIFEKAQQQHLKILNVKKTVKSLLNNEWGLLTVTLWVSPEQTFLNFNPFMKQGSFFSKTMIEYCTRTKSKADMAIYAKKSPKRKKVYLF